MSGDRAKKAIIKAPKEGSLAGARRNGYKKADASDPLRGYELRVRQLVAREEMLLRPSLASSLAGSA
jgi:hypothetical protein